MKALSLLPAFDKFSHFQNPTRMCVFTQQTNEKTLVDVSKTSLKGKWNFFTLINCVFLESSSSSSENWVALLSLIFFSLSLFSSAKWTFIKTTMTSWARRKRWRRSNGTRCLFVVDGSESHFTLRIFPHSPLRASSSSAPSNSILFIRHTMEHFYVHTICFLTTIGKFIAFFSAELPHFHAMSTERKAERGKVRENSVRAREERREQSRLWARKFMSWKIPNTHSWWFSRKSFISLPSPFFDDVLYRLLAFSLIRVRERVRLENFSGNEEKISWRSSERGVCFCRLSLDEREEKFSMSENKNNI